MRTLGVNTHRVEVQQWGGQFLADPNEVNGWGSVGVIDDTNSQDLGNADATALAWTAGGLVYPYDVELLRFFTWHRDNNAALEPWGWVISRLTKTDGTTAQTTDFIVHETQENGNVGPRDYPSTAPQKTVIDLSTLPNRFITGDDQMVNIAVAAPTADPTNRYVQVMGGYILYRRI